MGARIIDCPYCGRKLCTVNTCMDSHGSKVCSGCKIRIRYDYDHKTDHVSAGKA